MYVILVTNEKEGFYRDLAFDGRKTFISGSKKEAEKYKRMLSSMWPASEYVIHKLEKVE